MRSCLILSAYPHSHNPQFVRTRRALPGSPHSSFRHPLLTHTPRSSAERTPLATTTRMRVRILRTSPPTPSFHLAGRKPPPSASAYHAHTCVAPPAIILPVTGSGTPSRRLVAGHPACQTSSSGQSCACRTDRIPHRSAVSSPQPLPRHDACHLARHHPRPTTPTTTIAAGV